MPDIWTENPHTVPDGSVDWGGASGWGLVTGVLGSYPAQDQLCQGGGKRKVEGEDSWRVQVPSFRSFVLMTPFVRFVMIQSP